MSNKTKSAATKQQAASLDAEQVGDWLKTNPDFFDQHRETLMSLNLPSDAGTAVSLHQYQVRILRQEKADMDDKLALLVKHAKTNHKINQDLLDLAAKLIKWAAKDNKTPFTKLILKHFALQSINLIDLETDPLIADLKPALKKGECVCENEINTATLTYLFNDNYDELRSYAIVPIAQKKKVSHLLALGSDDKERFEPKMGAEFLQQLSGLVANLI